MIDWCRRHPAGRLLDIGADIGRYTLLGLTLLPRGNVVAFDSSIRSLYLLDRVCRFASRPDRLKLVYGFVTDAGAGCTLDAACQSTRTALNSIAQLRGPIDHDYVNLDHPNVRDIPRNTIDSLFPGSTAGGPTLIKIDVEGAEGTVIAGGRNFLSQVRPHLLVSIHPQFLGGFGTTQDAVLSLIRGSGYSTELLSVDHEEHWWCEPR
jgi:FkbM family methyltransferase